VEVDTIECTAGFVLDNLVLLSQKPIVLRGLVAHWPIVEHAAVSGEAAAAYVSKLYNGRPITLVHGEPDIGGRVAYNAELTKLNCHSLQTSLSEATKLMLGERDREHKHLYYMGTTLTDAIMPSFREQHALELDVAAHQYIWMGNRSCIPAHYDLPDNIACNVVGRRRFTLFPPEQVKNLYVGPLDFTPAGQAISLVDIRKPDLDRFPKYAEAIKHAQVIELAPGDALFLPSMWWHHVEGLDDFNVLVNYWWRQVPAYMSSPADVLELALLSIRDLPKEQKQHWKQLLDHYVFDADDDTSAHIPEPARGSLGVMNDTIARKIRARILSRLNR